MSQDIIRAFEHLAVSNPRRCNSTLPQSFYSPYSNAASLLPTTDSCYDGLLPYSPYYTPRYNGSLSSLSSLSSSSSSSVVSSCESDYTPSIRSSSSSSTTNTLPSIESRTEKTGTTAKHPIHNQPSVNSKLEKRDIYGFKRPTQWVDPTSIIRFDQKYQPILARQEEKWDAFLQEHNGQFPPLCPKLKRYTRKGIPHKYRAKAWMHYSGAKSLMDANPGMYQSMVDEAFGMSKDNEYAEVIYRDLHRTFPDNPFFCCAVPQQDGSVAMNPDTNPNLLALQRILMAFSVDCPHIGYCQSLNFIAGILLLVMENEEHAFWMLHVIVNDYLPEGMFDTVMEGATIEQTVLMHLVYDKMPGVWNKFGNKKCFWECENADNLPTITLVTSHWFLTLYINILPVETVLRVWDCMFVEGYKVLYRVALTIIKQNDRNIRNVTDPIDVFPILQNMPRRILDCHEFMEQVFAKDSISSDVTFRDIETRRSMFRERRRRRTLFNLNKKRNVAIVQKGAYL